MSHKNQSGFIAMLVEVAVAVLVIGVLGFIGWRLYSQPSKKSDNATSTSQNTSQTPISNNNQTATPAQTVDPNAGYFVIKEWGVRFKIPADLTGLEYKITYASDDPSDSYADFYTSQLASLVPECNPLAGSWSFGLIHLGRYPTSNEQPITGFGGRIAPFGGYNYYYGGNEAECPNDQTTKDTAQSINLLKTDSTELSNAVKSLEPAQGTWLDIKEFGIRILLNSTVSDAVYAPYEAAPVSGSSRVGISSQSLINLDKTNDCTAASAPLGLIVESATESRIASSSGFQTLTPDGKTVFKFGGNYYTYITPQYEGCSNGGATSEMVSSKLKAFGQSFATVQLDN